MVHVKDFRVEAGAYHRIPANRIGGAAEVGGEKRAVGVFQWKRMAPALYVIGVPVGLEDSQGQASDGWLGLESLHDFSE